MPATNRQRQDAASAVRRMAQLKVSEVDAAVGEGTTDGCHLSGPVLQGDTHDTEPMPE